ncbi:UNVERIFIED_ORG: HD-like signal output (HDOD) protein [Pseudomonas parafulva]|jgi:HD-like signal output (HDOD) protein|uniref:HDOD domain-containing protein n=1 Tax=Pseudomonas fulva TaxID=47880 RepID=A0A2L1WAS5_9PSED|nr:MULTISPECIES: HDOD domain-containing protein [Pseudomonas]MDP9555499.1 HD-like signal output (HDOD) protein [Pseudomonas parafulva]MDP9663113.1 HD-like signal output (HDOD) protein [Pseudomonas cremoricolorata]HCP31267.1 HDOD domain-containing protein [Pseudomonas sp.]AVF54524.1 HDOD domain-containing protein [Pseudomonas fulva]EST15657.1 HDOD domain protein [Pseudomonas putida S610]
MNKLAEMVQAQLLDAIEKDDLVLPTLPEVALSIREAAEDSEISVAALSRVIGRDAALSARLIKVVNSPLLRATVEVTELHTAITRLGINYSCNLAIGLVIEQIFHARSPAVEQKLREIWANSLEVAGMSYELARRYTRLKPDQAALGGLVNQIGALPVLIYAEEHNELLSDPVCLHHVIELIQPVLGDKILKAWEFPEQLVKLPGLVQDLDRQTDRIDYIDVVQIARCISQRGRERPLAALPAYRHLGLPMGSELHAEDLLEARSLLR